MAFVVLMIALIPLSYLFTTSLISAGQSTNQQAALSIAEKWTEVLSNTTPPVDDFGAVVTDKNVAPSGPAPTSSVGAVASTSNNHALSNSSYSTIVVTSSASFQPATAANQSIQINVGTVAVPNIDNVVYSSVSTVGTTVTFTCASSPCSQSPDTLATGNPVVQNSVVVPTETKGSTVYLLKASYSWSTAQNAGAASKPNLCTQGTPQLLKVRVTVSWGPNADANNVQDSVIINYPPAGVQTLGFIALELQGDLNAFDTQSPSAPWSARVQAPQVTISGAEPTFTVNPDSYGCVFAQVTPGTYTVSVAGAALNSPPGTTYGSLGSNPFVANAAGSVTNHVWSEPTSVSNTVASCGAGTTGATVVVGAVTRLQLTPGQSTCYPGFDQSTTFNLSYPSTSTVEDGVNCPGAVQITCVATGQNGSGAVATWANGSSWTNASLPSGVTRIAAIGCAGTAACIGVGYGANGAVVLHGTTGASPTIAADTLPVIANLNVLNATMNQVACPSASQCVITGATSGGTQVVLSGTIGATAAADTWTAETLPGSLTSISNLVCPATANGCTAIATSTSPASPLVISGPSGIGTWAAWTTPASGPTSFTVSALTQISCTSAAPTTCMAIGTGKINGGTSGPIVVSGLAGAGGLATVVPWSADTLTSTTVTALNQVICPTSIKCLVSGNGTSGASTGGLFLYGAPGAALSSEFPPGATSIGQTVCPSVSTCVALGTTTGSAPAIYTGTINTTDGWTSDTLPANSATSLSQVVCPTSTSCLAMGTGTNASNQPQAFLLDTTNVSTWSTVPLPSSDYLLYFDDIDCTLGASATCAAVGATPTGAVILSSANGPIGPWADTTPTGTVPVNTVGTVAAGVPIEISNPALVSPNTTAVSQGASANVTMLPNLYPFSAGYSLWAGDCASQYFTYNAVTPSTQPGGTTNVAVPLGLLSLQVLHLATGLPYAGATLIIKSATAGCAAGESYTLQGAGADGLSRTAVPYGSYTLYINGSSASYGTVTVSANSVSLGGSTRTLPSPLTASV